MTIGIDYRADPIRVGRQRAIPPMTESTALISSRGAGITTVEIHTSLLRRRSALVANVFVQVLPNEAFYFFMSNLSGNEIHRPKKVLLAPERADVSATTTIDSNNEQDNTVNAVSSYTPISDKDQEVNQYLGKKMKDNMGTSNNLEDKI